ncbi:MAG: AAA family ATPase [Alphaproteobacteria bacterium]|nr:AAA family ATPase [Alphaproteobacteria bacterium]
MREDFLWVEKYRPKKIEDTILPADLKATFQEFVNAKNIPNLILAGGPGVGKTTVARAMLEELGADYIMINGSMNGNIDTLRNEIKSYASSMSFVGGRKYVILDEADYLNPQSTQPALRNFMEEFSSNCGFILTCNYLNRIITPLHSRCSVIQFKIVNGNKKKLAVQFIKRVEDILKKENIEYEKDVIAEMIMKYLPDWRRVLNELQRYSIVGKIDSGILSNVSNANIKELIKAMKEKDFGSMRKWVVQNLDNEPQAIFRQIFDSANEHLDKNSIPQLVLYLAEYQYKAAFVVDQEINLVAFLTQVMADCEFKS